MRFKTYKQFLFEKQDLNDLESFHGWYFDLMISAGDKSMSNHDWVTEFDEAFGCAYGMASVIIAKQIRDEFKKADSDWKYFTAEIDEQGEMTNKKDAKEFLEINKKGWKVFDEHVNDNDDVFVEYLFHKPYTVEEKDNLSKKAVNYIKRYPSRNVSNLLHVLSKEDSDKLRGTIQGKKFGL